MSLPGPSRSAIFINRAGSLGVTCILNQRKFAADADSVELTYCHRNGRKKLNVLYCPNESTVRIFSKIQKKAFPLLQVIPMEESKLQAFVPVQEVFVPNIMVFGAGGAGGNVVTRMVTEGIQHVKMVICNTDQKALNRNKADIKIEMGREVTRGMGAGSRPEVGQNAAEECTTQIESVIKGANMVFIAAGMGGGTGTGAATNGTSPTPGTSGFGQSGGGAYVAGFIALAAALFLL